MGTHDAQHMMLRTLACCVLFAALGSASPLLTGPHHPHPPAPPPPGQFPQNIKIVVFNGDLDNIRQWMAEANGASMCMLTAINPYYRCRIDQRIPTGATALIWELITDWDHPSRRSISDPQHFGCQATCVSWGYDATEMTRFNDVVEPLLEDHFTSVAPASSAGRFFAWDSIKAHVLKADATVTTPDGCTAACQGDARCTAWELCQPPSSSCGGCYTIANWWVPPAGNTTWTGKWAGLNHNPTNPTPVRSNLLLTLDKSDPRISSTVCYLTLFGGTPDLKGGCVVTKTTGASSTSWTLENLLDNRDCKAQCLVGLDQQVSYLGQAHWRVSDPFTVNQPNTTTIMAGPPINATDDHSACFVTQWWAANSKGWTCEIGETHLGGKLVRNLVGSGDYDHGRAFCEARCVYFVGIWEVPVGSWSLAGSSAKGGFTRSITEGTSSTDSQSTTSTWAATITAKMKEGIVFESAELDVSISTSIATQVSSSFTHTESETCAVNCPPVAATPWVFVYQWITEAKHPGDDSFTTTSKTCNFICSYQKVGQPQAPKCPFTCCTDPECQQCQADCNIPPKRAV